MDSAAKSSKLGTRMMPYLAILQHDLKTLWASRLVRLWLAAAALLFIAVSVWDIGKFYSETDSAIAFLEEKEAVAPEFDLDIL